MQEVEEGREKAETPSNIKLLQTDLLDVLEDEQTIPEPDLFEARKGNEKPIKSTTLPDDKDTPKSSELQNVLEHEETVSQKNKRDSCKEAEETDFSEQNNVYSVPATDRLKELTNGESHIETSERMTRSGVKDGVETQGVVAQPPLDDSIGYAGPKDPNATQKLPDPALLQDNESQNTSSLPAGNGPVPQRIYDTLILDFSTVKEPKEQILKDLDNYIHANNLIFDKTFVIVLFSESSSNKNGKQDYINMYIKGQKITLVLRQKGYLPGFISLYLSINEAKGTKFSFVITDETNCSVIRSLLALNFCDMASWSAVSNSASDKTIIPFESFMEIDLNGKRAQGNTSRPTLPEPSLLVTGSVYMPKNAKLEDFRKLIVDGITSVVLVDMDNSPNPARYSRPKATSMCFWFFNETTQKRVKPKFCFDKEKKNIKIAPVCLMKKDSADCDIIKVVGYLKVQLNKFGVTVYVVSEDNIFPFFFGERNDVPTSARSPSNTNIQSNQEKREMLLETESDVRVKIIKPDKNDDLNNLFDS